MKKALLLSFGLLLMLASGLKAAPANVNFTAERGAPFQLVFDGRPLTRGNARQVHIDQLMPGYHSAEFLIPTGYGRFYKFRTRVFLDPGLETTFVLITRPGYGPALRKVAEVALRYGGPYGNGGYQNGQGSYQNDDDHYQRDEDRGGYGNGSNNGSGNGSSNGNGGYGNGNGSYGNGGQYPGNSGNYRVMAPQDVDRLAESLKRNSFDSNRLPIAKQALDQTYIQADDLKRLLDIFDFEASRVELAKYAYSRVADRQNFYRVYDAFDFPSNAQEVQRAVAGQQ